MMRSSTPRRASGGMSCSRATSASSTSSIRSGLENASWSTGRLTGPANTSPNSAVPGDPRALGAQGWVSSERRPDVFADATSAAVACRCGGERGEKPHLGQIPPIKARDMGVPTHEPAPERRGGPSAPRQNRNSAGLPPAPNPRDRTGRTGRANDLATPRSNRRDWRVKPRANRSGMKGGSWLTPTGTARSCRPELPDQGELSRVRLRWLEHAERGKAMGERAGR